MTRHRIFYSDHFKLGSLFELSPQATRHVQVLRLQPGQRLELFDGNGHSSIAQIERMGKQSVEVSLIESSVLQQKPACFFHAVVGMPANERMDWFIEKATELGVSRITPVMSQRSVIRLTGDRAEKRVIHWNGIAQSACCQSGRNWLPQIDLPVSFNDFIKQFILPADSVNALLSTHSLATHWRKHWITPPPYLTFVNGPEGGFSFEEEQFVIEHGFVPVSLGSVVLRSETAAIAVLSQLL
jgi:16S rRNA (uracil1498-N3)-methyltransferase